VDRAVTVPTSHHVGDELNSPNDVLRRTSLLALKVALLQVGRRAVVDAKSSFDDNGTTQRLTLPDAFDRRFTLVASLIQWSF
jgi:hypothetical protein